MCTISWTAPADWVFGEVVTAGKMMAQVKANFLETAPAKAVASGDIFQATGANAIARLAIGTAYQFPHVNAGATALEYTNGGMERIGEAVAAGGELFLTVSGIPTTFRHLRVHAVVRGSVANDAGSVGLLFNNDSSPNYAYVMHQINDAGAGGVQSLAVTNPAVYIFTGFASGSVSGSDFFTMMVADIPFYTAAVVKMAFARQFQNIGGGGVTSPFAFDSMGSWDDVNPITRVDLSFSGIFVVGSKFTVYGIR